METVAICIMIKNDQEYLLEWLSHHRELEIDHFYLYDNESSPEYRELGKDVTVINWNEDQYFEPIYPKINTQYHIPALLDQFPCTELITTHWPLAPDRDSKQFKAYQHCLNNYGDKHKWIAFIDSDEFINVAKGLTIKTALNKLDEPDLAQLLMKWRVFSSSGHLTKQPLQKEAYTDWYPDYQVKAFVKPDRIFAINSLHIMAVYPNFKTKTEDGQTRTSVSRHTHTSELIWVNHYWSRSRQDFEETKLSRKGGTTLNSTEHYEAKYAFIEKRAAYHMKKVKNVDISK